MRREFSRYLLMVTLVLFLAACKSVKIDSPEEGAIFTSSPDINLSFPSGKPDALEIRLNDVDITAQFAVNDTGAVATGANIHNFLVDGENHLKIVKPNTPLRKFVVDTSGPKVFVTNVTGSGTITVTGYVEDFSGVASLRANGNNVTLGANNTFSASIPNSSFVEFVATDTLGYVRNTRYARPGVNMPQALGVRINANGLNFLRNEVRELLTSDQLGPIVSAMNPIADSSFLGNGYRINVNDATIASASLNLGVTDVGANSGRINLSGSLHDFWADVSTRITVLFIPSTLTGSITVKRVDFTASALLGTSNGKLTADVSIDSFNMDTFRTHFNNFPDWLLTPFIWAFEWLLEWIVAWQMEDIAKEKILEFVDTFPDSLIFDINGGQLKPAIVPELISTPSSGVNVRLGAKLTAVTSFGPAQVGSWYVNTGALPLATTTPPGGTARDVGVVISQDMINQALAAATQAGILNVSLTDADIAALGGVDSGAASIRVRLVPKMAPTLDVVPALADGLGRLEFNDFYFAFDTKSTNQSEWKLLLGATLDIATTADLGVTTNNALAVDLIGSPRIKMRQIDPNSALVLNTALAQQLLNEFVPIVMPIILNAVGAIPLPTFEGYGFNLGGLWVFDNNGHFAGLAGNLFKVAGASMAAPRTYANLSGKNPLARTKTGSYAVNGNEVVIEVSGQDELGSDLQYRASLDGNPFGLWKPGSEVRLYNVRPGDHEVVICSRNGLGIEDPDCATVHFTVAEQE